MTQTVDRTQQKSDRMILTAMIVVVAMTFIDMTIVSIAAPDIQRGLHLSSSGLQWIVSGYLASLAAFFALGGRLADVVGHRTMVVLGSLVFIGASVMCGLTPDGSSAEAWIVTFRIIQGIGAAFLFPAALAVVVSEFPVERRGRAVAIFFAIAGGLTALGPFAGGYLIEISWRAIFFINVPVAALAVAVTLFATHESRDETATRQVDFAGIAALTIGLTALVLALVEGNAWGWSSPGILALLATALVGLVGFVAIETRVKAPIVDFSFFKSRSFLGANLVAFAISFGMFAVFFFLALYMQNILGYSPLETGVRFLPSTLVIMVAGPVAGRLADRIGPRTPLVIGLLCVTASLAWQSRIEVDTSFGFLVGAFVLLGVGMGFTMSPMSTAAMNAVDRTKAGVASGTLSMTRMVGGTFGVAALGALVASVGRHDLAESLPRVPEATRE
jgi:EmrB/QacA subfamily drug resistance transporter